MAGLALGVFTLIVVLSLFNGSRLVQRDRTLLTVPHANLMTNGEQVDWGEVGRQVLSVPGVAGVAPYLSLEVLLSHQGRHQVTLVKGIDPSVERGVSSLEEALIFGSFTELSAGSHAIILGRDIANQLQVRAGDAVNVLLPVVQTSPSFTKDAIQRTRVSLQLSRFTVAGIFDVNYNIGSNLAYINLTDAKILAENSPVELRLRMEVIEDAPEVLQSVLSKLQESLPTMKGEDWTQAQAALFQALRLEKMITGFMLLMIVAIGAFNIVSTLAMNVAERTPDVAILRTMGASRFDLLLIFLLLGLMGAFLGISFGTIAGIIVTLNFATIGGELQTLLNPQGLYVIGELPAVLQFDDVVLAVVSSLIISILAALYPAWRASGILPAEVLRYE